jgi:hypothetical protein
MFTLLSCLCLTLKMEAPLNFCRATRRGRSGGGALRSTADLTRHQKRGALGRGRGGGRPGGLTSGEKLATEFSLGKFNRRVRAQR